MGILNRFTEGELILFPGSKNDLSLRTKLLVTLIPSLMLILLVTGYITYQTSHYFLNQALSRTARIQAKAMAHEIESIFARSRRDALLIARNSAGTIDLRKTLAHLNESEAVRYCAIGFISQTDQSHQFAAAQKDQIAEIPASAISEITPDPFLMLEHLNRLKQNDIWISDIFEAEFPLPLPSNPNQKIGVKVIYFGTPCFSQDGTKTGYLILYLDVRHIRNTLSLYNSSKSPLWAFPRTAETRYAYFFDSDGWVLFQSEALENEEVDLTTDLARSTYKEVTLSKPGLPNAFQPASHYQYFWKMISDVKRGDHDLIEMRSSSNEEIKVTSYYLSYAPVFFNNKILGGIAYVDRTRFTLVAGYKHVDMMLMLSTATILAVSLIIFILSHLITKPIYKLAEVVNNIQGSKRLTPIDLHLTGYETNLLQNAINHLIEVSNHQMEEIRRRDIEIQRVESKERVELEDQFSPKTLLDRPDQFPEIIGIGPKIQQLKSDLLKAAGTEADVLIIGETGTGKQLAAEAIHRNSSRSTHPFISINCGELPENLLLDTLFGHVKGAFTEAKTDRKGAFYEAHNGTLFLDEIQTASLNVQQALLRAVAIRKIKPLGSDREIDVNVRLICATNIDLRLLIENRMFRSDLYFRLKVLTIHTPSLRDHKENIAVLINHYIKQLQVSIPRAKLGFSKGALEKMKAYNWPGNVRELMHCITRAAVMAENAIIQAEDILLEDPVCNSPIVQNKPEAMPEEDSPAYSTAPKPHEPENKRSQTMPKSNTITAMNSRQQEAWPYILANKTITRNDYQQQVSGNISTRTAIYDLKDLVKKGFLRKEGNGPATRYILIEPSESKEAYVETI